MRKLTGGIQMLEEGKEKIKELVGEAMQ